VFDDDLTTLEDGIRRLKIEYDIYFNGNRKKPPDDLKGRVDRMAKKLSEATTMSFPQRFRFNTLIARYCVLRDLWRRTLQDRESAGSARTERNASRQITAAPEPEAIQSRISVAITDPKLEDEKVRQLYEALLRMRGENVRDLPDISYQQFAKYLTTQTQGFRQKHHCARVVFTVALEENAVKFTATAEGRS
jgi:hypothetical protein